MDGYSLALALKKKIKEVVVYLGAFFVAIYFTNPELLEQLLQNILGGVGYGAIAMGILGVLLNKLKYTDTLPRLLEK